MPAFIADTALTPEGWRTRVYLEIDADGRLTAVEPDAGEARAGERIAGVVVPGMPNLHSHAFQRGMAGLAERAGPGTDDFWSWREAMYRFVARLDPEGLEAIATQLYVEMARAGYTSVAEFHYFHNDTDGTPYADRAETSERIVRAARRAGIGLTLLPVLYQSGGFGGAPAGEAQRRFVMSTDAWLELFGTLRARHGRDVRIGLALHSLRAVGPEALRAAVDAVREIDPEAPVHIHIAEQTREVEDCLAWSGARPVEWLLANAPVDDRWCLVHATHTTADERRGIAARRAVAGLCPTTEANLGDGFFEAPDFAARGGRYGVGSDSNVSVSATEELRWLEYGQRLRLRRRNVLAAAESDSVGRSLWDGASEGGAAALGREAGRLAPGRRADLLVLDPDHPALAGRSGDSLLDSFVFSGGGEALRDVMAGGRWIVRDRRHPAEEAAASAYRAAIARLA